MGKTKFVIDTDLSDLLFRGLFSLIFLGLGMEHLFSDSLIQKLMPAWVLWPRLISILCGLWLVVWGGLVLAGLYLRIASFALGVFLVVVTIAVHLPGVMANPPLLPPESEWMWVILQRSNLVKNLCLLGVCFHLAHHQVGNYNFRFLFKKRKV